MSLCVIVVFGSGNALAKTDVAGDPGWPREHVRDGNRLLVYQPQVDDWKNFHGSDLADGRLAHPKGVRKRLASPVRVTGSPSPTS